MMFLLRRIKNKMLCHHFMMTSKTLCHAELVSASQGQEILNQVQNDKVFNTPSYHSAEQNNPMNCFVRGFCGILKNIFKKIPQCVSLMRDDIKIRHTFKKALAFTLAETLIVMGIIGVVAALTIPNLNSSTADKEKVAKVKKIYSNINDAIGRAQAVYGPIDEWFQTDTTDTARATRFGERFTEFMKVSKNCSTNKTDCFKNFGTANATDVYKFISADGTSFALEVGSGSNSGRLDIFADIDGPDKGSSQIGKDIFTYSFSIEGGQLQFIYNDFSSYLTSCSGTGGGWSTCTAWVLQNDNLDYLKLKNGKCPNGKILDGTTNTSCK